MNQVKTVGSISISRSSNDLVYIRIDDEHSGDNILELGLTLEAYGLLCTGLSGIKGLMEVNTDANIAMKREGKIILTPDIKKYQDSALTEASVDEHFDKSNLSADGWVISDYGTRSRQDSSQGYGYRIKRYVPAPDPTDMEGKY